MSITGGQLVSYGIGAALASVAHGWRAMVAIGAVPAIVLLVRLLNFVAPRSIGRFYVLILSQTLLPFCPESPRQLIYHDKPEQAAAVIRRIFPNGTELQVSQKVEHITRHVQDLKTLHAGKSTLWKLKQLYVIPSNLRALIAGCGLMAISQLGGFNSLMYYSSTLFGIVGFSNPVAVGTIIAATNFIFTWV